MWYRDDRFPHLFRFEMTGINDGPMEQTVDGEGFRRERFERAMRLQNYGFSSVPPAGAVGYGIPYGLRRDRMAILGLDHYDHRRNQGPPGSATMYSQHGQMLRMFADRTFLDAGGKDVVVTNARDVTVEASREIVLGHGGRYSRFRGSRIDLAVMSPTDQAPARVMTESGPSDRVWAALI